MTANFRIIYNNAANRATLTASSQASTSLGVGNLLTDIKSQVCRSVGTSQVITATWPSAELLGGMMLAFSNLTSTGTLRVEAYTEIASVSPVYDSGVVLACPPGPLGLVLWGSEVLGVNAYSCGGFSYGRLWFPAHVAVKKIVVTIADPANPSGYVEIGRLITGKFWEGQRNVDYGVTLTSVDTTKNFRNDAGDLMSDIGPRHRKITFNLSNLGITERNTLWGLLRGNGTAIPVYLSLFPNAADAPLEQAHQIYGKLVTSPAMSMPSFLQYASQLDLEEI